MHPGHNHFSPDSIIADINATHDQVNPVVEQITQDHINKYFY